MASPAADAGGGAAALVEQLRTRSRELVLSRAACSATTKS
jgi:hypothetical protein